MKKLTVFIVFFLVAAFPVLGETKEYFENPGFESWGPKPEIPSRNTWRWLLPKNMQNGKITIERSEKDKFSGKASLHVLDEDASPVGGGISYALSPAEIKTMSGKIVTVSANIRQIRSSKARNVGIGIWIQYLDENGQKKSKADSRMIDETGTTEWKNLSFRMKLPEKTTLIHVSVFAAKGGGETAEAYFDDFSISVQDDPAVPVKPDEKEQVTQFFFLPESCPVNTEKAKAIWDRYSKDMIVREDHFSRPVIRNGTWFIDGKYQQYAGVTFDARNPQVGDWPPRRGAVDIDHIAYKEAPSKKVFDILGINSIQMAVPSPYIDFMVTGVQPAGKYEDELKRSRSISRNLEGMPIIGTDFPGTVRDLKKNPEKARQLDQRSSMWHEFLPWCPESPEGREIYRRRADIITKLYMEGGSNVYVYELTNEPTYNCQCRYNAAIFAEEMQKKFGSIESANKIWNTVFLSFDELKEISQFENYPKLWPDWCAFSAKQYRAFLKMLKDQIRKVDQRPNVYFTEQCGLGQIFDHYGAGTDFREHAKELEVLSLEGGLKYGIFKTSAKVSDLEAVVFSDSTGYLFACDFYQALSEGKKPITNNEYYCLRTENGKRIPSKKIDLVTSFWTEFFHGISSTYVYNYDKRHWEWKNLEEARKVAEPFSYKSSSMLNPFNWPPSELDGFAEFQKEIAPFLQEIAPFPRVRPATVALLYPRSTHLMTGIHRLDFKLPLLNWYKTVLLSQYPVKIVFEDSLDKTLTSDVKVLLAPAADYCPEYTIAAIRKFRQRGGTVIADENAFRFDERENPRKLDFQIHRLSSKNTGFAAELRKMLSKQSIRYGYLKDSDGKYVTDVDFQMIDRKGVQLCFLLAPDTIFSRKVKLHLADAQGGYLCNPVAKEILLPPNGKKWSKSDFAKGAELILPGQERLLLAIYQEMPKGFKEISTADIEKRWNDIEQKEQKQRENIEYNELVQQKKEREARFYTDVNAGECEFVNLRPYANMGFADKTALDKKGGWFDEGVSNDFGSMKTGRQTLSGVPFDVIVPETNNGKSCIVLHSINRPYFPVAVKDVAVGKKARNIYFLHSMGYGVRENTAIAEYQVNYDDGSKVSIPIRFPIEIGEWWGNKPIQAGKIAVESLNQMGRPINMQCFRWKNPYPDKKIRSLDFVSLKTGGIPGIVAVTLER